MHYDLQSNFFFLIGKKNIFKKLLDAKKTPAKQTYKNEKKQKEKQKSINYREKES